MLFNPGLAHPGGKALSKKKKNNGNGVQIEVRDADEILENEMDETVEEQDLTVTLSAEEHQELLDQIEELKEQHLRTAADFDNARKRLDREREDLVCFANERLINDLLPILDNLERALSTQLDQASIDSILAGVKMVNEQLHGVLKSCGLEPIDSVGGHFDPNLHEAVGVLPSPEHDEGQVVSELQKGYSLKGRVLRPSMVHVAGPGARETGDDTEEGNN
jgi:molecular chaperone GrpE